MKPRWRSANFATPMIAACLCMRLTASCKRALVSQLRTRWAKRFLPSSRQSKTLGSRCRSVPLLLCEGVGMRLDSPLTCISFLERVHRLGAVCVYGPGVSSLSLSLSLYLSLRRRAIRRYTTVIVSCSPVLARECSVCGSMCGVVAAGVQHVWARVICVNRLQTKARKSVGFTRSTSWGATCKQSVMVRPRGHRPLPVCMLTWCAMLARMCQKRFRARRWAGTHYDSS
jgi:hypothetical protein